ncbi:hypothetical protein [Lysinibacillus phage vB_LspM-01]|nr:hypothetical protein [Lysinibacillus phage vB_LspM-01]
MYKVGDKAVILDADKISKARELEFENGIAYEVVDIEADKTPVLKHNEGDQELQFFKNEMKYIEKVEKINCEIGDKFVILDVDKILHAESCGFENGVAYEVVKILEDGSPVLEHDTNGRELYFYERELKYIKAIRN